MSTEHNFNGASLNRNESLALCPAQQKTLDWFLSALPVANIFVLWSYQGRGKTTVLHALHRHTGGAFLCMKDYMAALAHSDPNAMEETFERLLLDTLAANDVVIFDDIHLLTDVIASCGSTPYPRNNLVNGPLTTVADFAIEHGKRLIVGSTDGSYTLGVKGYSYTIEKFSPADYAHIGKAYLGKSAEGIDFTKVHRYAPKLNGHQLRSACVWLQKEDPHTDRFIEYLRSQQMASNVDLGEVEAVELSVLRGVDDVIQSLEANIIVPLEDDVLAEELNIKPKRGVLLAGPPGTGKTTVGRALAHRLQSKFFMIDGTFISGSHDFYQRVHQVFEAAKQNAPAVIFIDDSDVIFENNDQAGLYRYLLTMLDGLESESAGRVCVMMTAMDVGNLPPALVRSGRIELWLETRLPEDEARREILLRHLDTLPKSMGQVDIEALASVTEGLTGADLKRVVEDGKLLYAYDRSRKLPLQPTTEYFTNAVVTVRSNKEKYAEAEAQARQRHPSRPSFFDMFGGMMPPPSMDDED